MAYMTNREFAEHEYNRQKRNAYADTLAKEVRQLREENELLQAQLAEYEALAAEYGIDGKTMLTLAKSQIKTAKENIMLREALEESQRRAQDARNELCIKCGRYHEAHKGACDGCRWIA